VLFRLCDVRETTLADQEELLDTRLIRQALDFVRARSAQVEEALDLALDGRVFEPASSREEYFDRLRVCYRVPFDWSTAPHDYFDAAVSRAVLEHVEPDALNRILSELRRIVHPTGLMCHFIDNSDHWEHIDKSISRVNFLQFSESRWRLMGLNKQDYMNRLRHSDYLAMFASCGFEILHEWARVDENALRALETLPLVEPFTGRDRNDLATIETRIVARRSRAAPGLQ
jgi:SAM-dependent methyltransferase